MELLCICFTRAGWQPPSLGEARDAVGGLHRLWFFCIVDWSCWVWCWYIFGNAVSRISHRSKPGRTARLLINWPAEERFCVSCAFFCRMRFVDRRGSTNAKLQRSKRLIRRGFPWAWLHAVEEKKQKAGLCSSDSPSDPSIREDLREFLIFSQHVSCQADRAAFYEHLKVRVFSLCVNGCQRMVLAGFVRQRSRCCATPYRTCRTASSWCRVSIVDHSQHIAHGCIHCDSRWKRWSFRWQLGPRQ